MRAINKQLKILSEAEISALYEIPDFDYEQRLEYSKKLRFKFVNFSNR
jgi:hypothetical protein